MRDPIILLVHLIATLAAHGPRRSDGLSSPNRSWSFFINC